MSEDSDVLTSRRKRRCVKWRNIESCAKDTYLCKQSSGTAVITDGMNRWVENSFNGKNSFKLNNINIHSDSRDCLTLTTSTSTNTSLTPRLSHSTHCDYYSPNHYDQDKFSTTKANGQRQYHQNKDDQYGDDKNIGEHSADKLNGLLDDSDIWLGEIDLSLVTEQSHQPDHDDKTDSSPKRIKSELPENKGGHQNEERRIANQAGGCVRAETDDTVANLKHCLERGEQSDERVTAISDCRKSLPEANDSLLSDSFETDLFEDSVTEKTCVYSHMSDTFEASSQLVLRDNKHKNQQCESAFDISYSCSMIASSLPQHQCDKIGLLQSCMEQQVEPDTFQNTSKLCNDFVDHVLRRDFSSTTVPVSVTLLDCNEVKVKDSPQLTQKSLGSKMPAKENTAQNQTLHKDLTVSAGSCEGLNRTCFKDRLKQRLIQNATVTSTTETTVTSRILLEEMRNENIARAALEASQIRREGMADGIGPFYGLPTKVQELLWTNRKISKLYDWQDQCLRLPAVLEGRNLIYTLPTSGGKTLVAELLILRQLLCKKKDALIILPYVSIVQEKVRIMSEFATQLGFLIEEYAGSKGRIPPTRRRQKNSLLVATIEKAQSLVNSLLEAGRLSELGLVVVDELHMIGEGRSRGAAMESTILKLVHAAKDSPQVVGMSATLNNMNDLAQFLNAQVFSSDFRPVSLTEYVKVDDSLYQVDMKALVPEERLQYSKTLTFQRSPESTQMDPENLLQLVLEIVPDHSCLLFCPTKRYCENVALLLARMIAKNHSHLDSLHKEKRRNLLQELHGDGGGKVCPTLKRTIPFGLAYHHSGLTTDERRLIEDAYSDGMLCVLVCTSTLAAGVNLPAKRVILRSPYIGVDFIKHSQYKQMTGRAGRAGIDSSGESILICKKSDLPRVQELLSGPQDVCHSSLMYEEGKGLRALILSLIGLKLVETTEAVFAAMQKTLLAVQASGLGIDVLTATQTALQDLLDQGLVIQKLIKDFSPSQHQQRLNEKSQPEELLSVAENSQQNVTTSLSQNQTLLSSQTLFSSYQGYSLSSLASPSCVRNSNQLHVASSQNCVSDVRNSQIAAESQCVGVSLNGIVRNADYTGKSEDLTEKFESQDLFDAADEHSLTHGLKKIESAKCDPGCEPGNLLAEHGDGRMGEHGDDKTIPCLKDLKLQVTCLGRASFKGSIDLQFGARLYRDLKHSEQSLVVANHLHLLYLITPYDLADEVTPNWNIYLHQLGTLAVDEMKVVTLVGVSESYIARRASGQSSRQKMDLAVVQRFYLTLMLHELWKQYSVWDVSERFQQPRGYVQSLLSSAASFASCVLRFTQELPEFWAYQDLLVNFSKRLNYCVSMELIPLMEIPGMKLARARQLYDAGFESLQSLTGAEIGQLVSKVQFLSHKAARQIISAAKVVLEEKMSTLLEQVEELVPAPLSLQPAQAPFLPQPSSIGTYSEVQQLLPSALSTSISKAGEKFTINIKCP